MRRFTWTILAILFLQSHQNLYAQVSKMDAFAYTQRNETRLSKYYYFLKSCADSINPAEAREKLQAGGFSKYADFEKQAKVINFGFTGCSYWLAVNIRNDSTVDVPVFLSFYNNDIEFTVYTADSANNLVPAGRSSTHNTRSERPAPVRSISYRLFLHAGKDQLVFIHVRLLNTDNVYFPSDITSPEEFYLYEIDYSFLLGRFIGYFVFAFIFNILLWIALRNRIHLWHAGYIASLIGFNLNEFMFDSIIFPDNIYHYWVQIPKVFFILSTVFFGINAFRLFINQKKEFPIFFRITTFFNYLVITALLLVLSSVVFMRAQSGASQLIRQGSLYIAFLGIAILISSVIVGLIKKNTDAILYFISAFFLVLTLVDFILNTLNITQLFFIEPGNIIVALTIEISILTIFFVFKYRKEKQKALRELGENLILRKNRANDIIRAEENERKKIAEDLHDDVASTLSLLNWRLNNIDASLKDHPDFKEYFQICTALSSQAVNDVRSISHELLPKDFDQNGIFQVLRNRIDALNNSGATRFSFRTEGESHFLSSLYAVTVFRIINELLTNIIKHSTATEVLLELLVQYSETRIILTDNGEKMHIPVDTGGMGVKNIFSRVAHLNGKVFINPADQHNQVTIRIPSEQKNNHG